MTLMMEGLTQINPFVIDRRSKYAVSSFMVVSEADFKEKMRSFLKDKKIRQADHNIVAYRIKTSDGRINEYKNDGYSSPSKETGAGVRILEIMRQKKAENICIVVTRWYGGIHLGPDRFKHVRDAAIEILKMESDEQTR